LPVIKIYLGEVMKENILFKKLVIFFIIFSIIGSALIYHQEIIAFFNSNNHPSEKSLEELAYKSIREANNFCWDSYKGTEGEEYFTKSSRKEYFREAVDLKFIKDFKVISAGNIEKIVNINPEKPSIRFIADRTIKTKDGKITNYWNEVEYICKYEDNKWLIDKVKLISSGRR